MTHIELEYHDFEGPADYQFAAAGYEPLTTTNIELAIGEMASEKALQAAGQLRQTIIDDGGPELELHDSYPPVTVDTSSHLRIYDVPGFPAPVAARYSRDSAPAEYDWALLKMQKDEYLRPIDLGDIPEMTYSVGDVPVCRRVFAFDYQPEPDNTLVLTVTETPGWARNDGSWVDGASATQVYRGVRYDAWRTSARERIYSALKFWLPTVLLQLGFAADRPAGEAVLRNWLAAHHALPWQHYLSSGAKDAITASLNSDTTTPWLDAEVPNGLLDGVPPLTTVRGLILLSLR